MNFTVWNYQFVIFNKIRIQKPDFKSTFWHLTPWFLPPMSFCYEMRSMTGQVFLSAGSAEKSGIKSRNISPKFQNLVTGCVTSTVWCLPYLFRAYILGSTTFRNWDWEVFDVLGQKYGNFWHLWFSYVILIRNGL